MNIRVCGLSELPLFQATHDPTHILTLMDPEISVKVRQPVEWLRLDMYDVEENVDGYIHVPQKEQVQKIIDFARALPDDANLLVHCFAGQSRSTAAALIIMVIKGYTVGDAIDKLLAIRNVAAPNKLICKYADELLGLSIPNLEWAAHYLNARTPIEKGPVDEYYHSN